MINLNLFTASLAASLAEVIVDDSVPKQGNLVRSPRLEFYGPVYVLSFVMLSSKHVRSCLTFL